MVAYSAWLLLYISARNSIWDGPTSGGYVEASGGEVVVAGAAWVAGGAG